MIRTSEMVLAGHPDKFCDRLADLVVARVQDFDPEGFAQIEAGVWGDELWLSGAVTLPGDSVVNLEVLANDLAASTRYRDATGSPRHFHVADHVCRLHEDPRRWTRAVNDQAICVGWAGYDEKTHYLPPEHFLAHVLREALESSFESGSLQGEGPDGKLLLCLAEEGREWRLERILATVEQADEKTDFRDFHLHVAETIGRAYDGLRAKDRRWVAPWDRVTLLINPNGPLIHAGPEADNGQTGRKLAMDYYGPRIGQGGGALSGKHASHIDRIGSWGAREASIHAVRSGADSCRIVLAYAPNCDEPLEIVIEMEGRGEVWPREDFRHGALRERYKDVRIDPAWGAGRHFWDRKAPWNAAVSTMNVTSTEGASHGSLG